MRCLWVLAAVCAAAAAVSPVFNSKFPFQSKFGIQPHASFFPFFSGAKFPHAGFPAVPHAAKFPHAAFPKFPKFIPKPKPVPTTTTTTTTAAPNPPEPPPRPQPKKQFLFPAAGAKVPHAGLFFPQIPHAGKFGFPAFPHAKFPLFPKKPEPVITPEPVQPSEEPAPEIDREICRGLADGAYPPAEGCAPYFLTCTGGIGRREPCAAGTFYDVELGACQFRRYVRACGGSPPPIPDQGNPSPNPPLFEFDCSDKPDGSFENPNEVCSQDYVVCSGGQEWFQSCMEGMFFDVISTRCLAPEHVKWCGGVPTETPVPDQGRPVPPPFEFSCVELPDGVYEDPRNPCSADYVSCTGGAASFLRCYGNLKYDVLSGRCIQAIHVKWCGGVATEAPEIPVPDQPQNPGIDFDCKGKPDGDYENPEEVCSRFYFSCSGEEATFRFCPMEEMRYDVISGQCLAEEFVEWCGGLSTTLAPEIPRDQPEPPFVFECAAQADGLYDDPTNPCSPWYVACVGGSPRYNLCPENLIFDWPARKCIAPGFSAGCKGIPTEEPQVVIPERVDIGFDCSSLEDGYYPNPQDEACAASYIGCSGGAAELMGCAEGTFWEADARLCLRPEFVPACGGVATEAPIPNPNPQPIPDPECEALGEGRYPIAAGACSQEYFICAPGNQRIPARCEGETFFDADDAQCFFKRNVPACGGSKPRPVPRPAPNPEPERPEPKIVFPSVKVLPGFSKIPHPASGKLPVPHALAPKAVFAPHAFSPFFPSKFIAPPALNTKPNLPIDCRFLPDGFYGEKCGKVFFECEHGVGKGSANCRPGQAWNLVECVPEEQCQ